MSLNQTYGAQGISELTKMNLTVKVNGTGPDRTVPIAFQTNASCVAFTICANTTFTESGSYYEAVIPTSTPLATRVLPKNDIVNNNRRLVTLPGNVNGVFSHIHLEINGSNGILRFYNNNEGAFTSFRFYEGAQAVYML
jgi:hypothetical protein